VPNINFQKRGGLQQSAVMGERCNEERTSKDGVGKRGAGRKEASHGRTKGGGKRIPGKSGLKKSGGTRSMTFRLKIRQRKCLRREENIGISFTGTE